MASVDLGDFLGHLGDAIKIARDGCARANIATLKDFLVESEDDDHSEFRTICIKIGEELIDVPLYGLTPQGYLDLDRIDVEFETVVSIQPSAVQDVQDRSGNPKFSITLSRGVLSRSTEMTVRASFSLKEACETAEQIRDKINKMIPLPRNHKEDNNGGV